MRTLFLTSIPGGTGGIGAAIVKRYYASGAHVIFSDINTKAGKALEDALRTDTSSGGTATFTQVDVTDYAAQLSQFDLALQLHGRVDQAIYSAGVTDAIAPNQVIGPGITLETVRERPAPLAKIIEINLTGSLYFERLALAYLQHGMTPAERAAKSKSLTLISSANGFLEVPGLFGYLSSKHGMIGQLRTSRVLAPATCGVRINLIAPSATNTEMIANYIHLFTENGIPLNSADDVARYTQAVGGDAALNGLVVYVVGGKGFDVDEGIFKLLPQWLGEENAKAWDLHNEVFNKMSESVRIREKPPWVLHMLLLLTFLQGSWTETS